MLKFQDFSATKILRAINFGHLKIPKTALWLFEVLWILNIWIFFDIHKCEFPKKSKFNVSKIVKMTVCDPLNSAKIDFT